MEKSKTRQIVKNIIIEEKGYAGKGFFFQEEGAWSWPHKMDTTLTNKDEKKDFASRKNNHISVDTFLADGQLGVLFLLWSGSSLTQKRDLSLIRRHCII